MNVPKLEIVNADGSATLAHSHNWPRVIGLGVVKSIISLDGQTHHYVVNQENVLAPLEVGILFEHDTRHYYFAIPTNKDEMNVYYCRLVLLGPTFRDNYHKGVYCIPDGRSDLISHRKLHRIKQISKTFYDMIKIKVADFIEELI